MVWQKLMVKKITDASSVIQSMNAPYSGFASANDTNVSPSEATVKKPEEMDSVKILLIENVSLTEINGDDTLPS